MFREDQEATRDLPDLPDPEDSPDHRDHLARTASVGKSCYLSIPPSHCDYCQTDRPETRGSRVKLGVPA